MKHFISILLILVTVWNPTNAQTPPKSIFKGISRIDIPFQNFNNFLVVNVILDKKIPLKFVFDTGAEFTILTKKSVASLLHWRYQREFRIMGADLKTELVAYLVTGISLDVGNIQKPNSNILVLEDDYFKFDEFTGSHIQGILGADFFKRFVVRINYRTKVISLYNPSNFKAPKDFEEVKVDIVRNKPYISADVGIKDSAASSMRLLMDTGASLSLLLHTFTHKDLYIPQNYIKGNLGMGLGGYIDGYMARLKTLKIGPYPFKDLIVNYQEYTPDRDTTFLNGRNGLIGNDLLNKFTIIIDYVREKLYMKPNKNYYKGVSYDKSGIIFLATGLGFTTFIVYEVLPGSPADLAGIKKGDVLKRLNGLPTSFLSLKSINRKLKAKPGKKIRMVIKRDNERIKRRFILRDLL